MRIVLDTNVLVSALIKEGKPRDLWKQIVVETVKLIISEELFLEFSDVTARPHLKKYIDRPSVAVFQRMLAQKAEFVMIIERLQHVTADPDDNIVVETAIAGDAEYVVSGDRHLLGIRKFDNIQIVSVTEMLKIIEPLGKRL